MSNDDQPKPRRGRIFKILGALAVLLLLFLVLAPILAQSVVKGLIEDGIEERYAVDATIDSLSLSLFGTATIAGLRLVDERGRDVLELERAEASLGLLSALGGTYVFDAAVDGLSVHVYEEADGTWSAQSLPRARDDDEKPPSGEPSSFDLRGSAFLREATVSLVRRDGLVVQSMLNAEATFAGPDTPAALRGAVEVAASSAAPGARAGRVVMQAELPGDPGTWGDVAQLVASASVDFEHPLDLAPLAPALAAGLPVDLRAGVLGGSGRLSLAPGLDLTTTAGFTLDGLELVGPRAGAAPFRLERVSLDASTEATGDGALTPRLALRADNALAVTLEGTLSGAGTDDARLAAQLTIDGDAGDLARLADGWVLLREGLTFEGALVGGGPLEVALSGGALARAGGKLELGLEDLTAHDVVDGPIELGELGRPKLSVEASYDASRGAVDVPAFALVAGPIDARGQTSLRGLGGAGADKLGIGTTTCDVVFDLDALAQALEGVVDLGNTVLAGRVDMRIDAREENGLLPVTMRAEVRGLALRSADGGTSAQGDLTADVRGTWADGALDATVSLTGKDIGGDVPDTISLALGSLRADLRLAGTPDEMVVGGDGELLALVLRTPGADGERGIEIDEPRFLFDVDATVGAKRGDLDLRRLHLESRTIAGDVNGRITGIASLASEGGVVVVETLAGDLTYVPDQVAAALGPLLPGQLSGANAEPCKFHLDGRVTGMNAAAIVEGLTGTVDVGVGRYRQTGLDIGGQAHLALRGGQATLTSELQANGGEMKLDGELVLTPTDAGLVTRDSRITLDAQGVQANSGLGPLLGFVHPMLGGFDNLNETKLGGIITCAVDLRYAGDLSTEMLAGGWEALPKDPINGKITFALDGASIGASPLIQQLLGKLNLGGEKDFDLKPITLNVAAGRISYATPWEWTVRGAKTTFGGSIGLDKTLDLEWSIPITDEVVASNEFLKQLKGQTISLPISGTLMRPKLETDGLVKGLASDVVKNELKEALGSLTGKVDADPNASDPASLLKRADDLWDQNDKAGAAKLYAEIREKHKVSLVYAMNRDRIKERAGWKP